MNDRPNQRIVLPWISTRALCKRVLLSVSFLSLQQLAAVAQTSDNLLRASEIGINSGFFAGAAPRRMAQLTLLGLSDLRDGVQRGEFDSAQEGQTARGSLQQAHLLSDRNLLGSLVLMPNAHNGRQPVTVSEPEALDRFGKYAADIGAAFPDALIEIANEFNGNAFVTGPAVTTATPARAALHADHLAAVSRAGVPRARVLGGAAHSISAGYIWAMLGAGASRHMSAVTIHPYTTQPEAFARQLAVLRRHPDMRGLAVDFTEIGTTNRADAADYFWRSYCEMSRAGVRRAQWYPLEPRGDGYAALLDQRNALTPVGRALLLAQSEIAGRPIDYITPAPFTQGCIFDNRFAVLWGEPRPFDLRNPDLQLRHADTRVRKDAPDLHPQRVLLVIAQDKISGIDPDKDFAFGKSEQVADSFLEFHYPKTTRDASENASGTNGRFTALIRDTRGERALSTCPGQDRPQAPWTPYLCDDTIQRAVLHDRGFTLGGNAQNLSELIWRQSIDAPGVLRFDVETKVIAASDDGIVVRLERDGQILQQQSVVGETDIAFGPFGFSAGDTVDLVIAPGRNPKGDAGLLRLRVYDQDTNH
ncbi:hypothetical protein [Sagittula sp. SSi028]|uniref:hypothetical protein n=1 Tax=Sagittula sp. SSi028 TaxID=3400636 RepID=UPI003AF85D5A